MKRTVIFFTSLIIVILMGINVNAQVLLNEQFDYPVGDSLSAHGWAAHSGTGPIFTISGNLSYTGYCTPIGQSALITNTASQDMNHSFTAPTSGSVYAALLINVTSATTTGDYFFHFFKPTSTYVGRVFIKRDATDATKFTLGVLKGSTTANTVYSPTLLSMDTTYLIVLKYTINSGTGDDVVSLFVNPATASEGTPTITASDVASTDLDPVGAIALRQGNASVASTLTVDGLRVATTWADAIGFSGTVVAPTVTTGITTGITSNTATCEGNVTADGGAAITERGICYGTVSNPDISGTKVIVTGTTGTFAGDLTTLTSAALYHYRAYATNSVGTSYGADSTFTTASGAVAPVVTTGAVSAITTTTATVAGDVTNDGGSTVTARGICYGTILNPIVSGSIVTVSGTTGAFTANLTGLTPSTLYHVRAYATNAIGTAYGADVTFTTSAIIPTYTIGQVRGVNANGVADSLNVICNLTGIVHGINYDTITKYSFFIMDATSGINVYKAGTLGYTVTEGDSIMVTGSITQYNGLIEFAPTAITLISSGRPLLTPSIVTVLDETTESRLVEMQNLTYLSGWPTTAGNTVNAKAKLGSDTITIRIFKYCNLQGTAAPTSPFSIIGIGSQYDSSSPYTSGYQIYPRYVGDIITGINEIEANKIGIYPNPSNGKFTINVQKFNNGEIKVYSMVGSLILSQQINKANNEFDLSSYGRGMYFVQYTDTKSGKSWTEKLIVK